MTEAKLHRTVRVVPNPAGGWDVKEPGARRALGHAASQRAAVRLAPSLLTGGGQVEIYDAGGALDIAVPVGRSPRVWWEVGPTNLLIGALLIASSLIRLSTSSRWWWTVPVTAVMGVILVVTAIASIRRRRRLRDTAAQDVEDAWRTRPSSA